QLKERTVGQRVVAHNLGRVLLIAARTDERDRDLVGAFNHVIVGEDVAGLVDHEAGAGALGELALRRLTLPRTLPRRGGRIRCLATEEAAQEVVSALTA